MAIIPTFGQHPTLGEMKAYYAREDVISFLYEECQTRLGRLFGGNSHFGVNSAPAPRWGILKKMDVTPVIRGFSSPTASQLLRFLVRLNAAQSRRYERSRSDSAGFANF